MTKIATGAGALLVPGPAVAHSDHAAGGDWGLLHYLTDPFHLLLTGAAVAVWITVRRAVLRHRSVNRETS